MDWKKYFAEGRGSGFLATAGADGEVNIAIYSRPHVLEDGSLAFGMTDRLTHANIRANPKAVYAYQERGFQGVRLYLEVVGEDDSGPVLDEIRRRANEIVGPGTGEQVRHLVRFRVTRALTLVGPNPVAG